MMTHPAVLARLVQEYETESELHAAGRHEPVRRRLEDVAYTLCVSTGTRDVDAALAAARERLRTLRLSDVDDVDAAAQGGRRLSGTAG
ncbi:MULTISPECIES: DUF5133 domain-containing protein [unclassified Streptomyces]|uniref:DUF5133 domain-containing protein n=1 Tax=unclassified Streptomyces TaxID=2593676 RepID=UPI0035E23C15